jgi:glycosyltransferase involved in cell wall biosynthesis
MLVSFNQKEFVAEAIESAVSQDYENLEVVISDDGSTDGTAEIISQCESRYPGRLVALLNADNVGITRNCNRALRACSGELVAFVGGDDVLMPGKIAAQVDWFAQDPRRVLCGHLVELIGADGSHLSFPERTKACEGVGPKKYIRLGPRLPGISTMVRANAIPPHGFDEQIPIASDYLFWIELLTTGGHFGCIDAIYAKQRVHANNVSGLRVIEMFDDRERIYRLVGDRYPQYRPICMEAIIRHVTYYRGVYHLERANKPAARAHFLSAIKKDPLFLRAWLRLLQSL